jgi:hypothetical protein
MRPPGLRVRGRILHIVGRAAAAFVCVAGVPIVTLILVRAFYGVPISAYRPIINDEVAYWHQALTFSYAGFHGGYYTLGEATNPSGVTPFGPHGPGFAVLYGTFGAAFGWHRHSVVLLNLLAISVAAWTWVSLSRLSLARLFLSGVMLVTFWHMLFWAPTGMQEPLHHAGAIAMAACFAAALGPSRRPWVMAAGWIVLSTLSFIRPSWIALFPLWALASSRTAPRWVMLSTIAASGLLAGALLLAYSLTTAPYSTGFFFLRALSLTVGAQSLADNLLFNVNRLAMLDQYEIIEHLHRYQYWVFLIAAIVAAAVALWRSRAGWRTGPAMHLLIAAVAMAAALAAMLLLYEFTNYAEHRVLSAFFLFGALLCLAAPGRVGPILVAALVLSNVAYARPSLRNFEAVWRDRFIWDRRGVYELEDAVDEGILVYRPGLSRWCNTLLTAQYPPHLIAIPPGIGISAIRETEQLPLPPRSHYLLLDASSLANIKGPLHLEPKATLPYGTLFVNRDSGCE